MVPLLNRFYSRVARLGLLSGRGWALRPPSAPGRSFTRETGQALLDRLGYARGVQDVVDDFSIAGLARADFVVFPHQVGQTPVELFATAREIIHRAERDVVARHGLRLLLGRQAPVCAPG